MGTVCGKPSSSTIKDSDDSPKQRELNRKTSELRAISSKRNESFRVKRSYNSGEIKVNLVDKNNTNSWRRVKDDDQYDKQREKEKDNSLIGFNDFSTISRVPKALEAEQISAGWPSWLVQVASEAIKGWIPRKSDTFEKLDKIGQGTYSSVFKAKDLTNNKIVALKRVRFDNMDHESIKFMAREIVILRKLNHPNIIKLEGLVTSRSSGSLYLIFEYMEHDITGLSALPAKFTEPQIKCFMKQILSGLDHCHSRGILHRDIKGSNLLVDDNGILKIGDFGLASFYNNYRKVPLTTRVVTLWYRPPELLLGAVHYGVGVDLWSTGCILGELFTGQPIMPGKTEVEQMHKIFKLCGSPSDEFLRDAKLPLSNPFKPQQPYRRRVNETFKDLPSSALGLLETLLSMDPQDRGSAALSLESEFFTTKPYACDPSTLPKYPPSKEIDAKLREEEFRRRGALDNNGRKGDNESRRSKDVHGVPILTANTELARSLQRRHDRSTPKLLKFNKDEESSYSVPFEQPRLSQASSNKDLITDPQLSRKLAHSGPLGPGIGWTRSIKKSGDISNPNLTSTTTLSGLVSNRVKEDSRGKIGNSQIDGLNRIGRPSASYQEQGRRDGNEEFGRARSREPVVHRDSWKGNNINFSGPLLGPTNKMEELLKEHDRRIQEVARRTRLKKIGVSKVHNQSSTQVATTTKHMSISSR